MACKTCSECKWNVIAICRCCQLVDKDSSKKEVCFCETCKNYLCRECMALPYLHPKRVTAFTLNLFTHG